MIKFFRKIRQNLLIENKIGKYLKYAIGEILLVIIGILIAVSINSWNENRKLKIQEQSILKDLKQEVMMNHKALEAAIEENEKSFQAAIEMKSLFKNREVFNSVTDSMFYALIRKINNNYTYDPQNGILNSVISSGQINNLSDKELKYLLASIQELSIDALEDTRKIERQRDELMKSSWQNAMIIENNQIIGHNVKSFYDHPDFRWATNHLFHSIRRAGLAEEKELKSTLEHIIERIDRNIEK